MEKEQPCKKLMDNLGRRKKSTYRIAACIIAAMISASPAAAVIQAYAAEESTEEETEHKKKGNGEDTEEDSEEGSTETASVEEPEYAVTEEPGQEDPARPESSVREALDNERAMVADEDILLIRIGYEFDDGSFDEWIVKIYESVSEASKSMGIAPKTIRDVANGKYKHGGGFCWKYADQITDENKM